MVRVITQSYMSKRSKIAKCLNDIFIVATLSNSLNYARIVIIFFQTILPSPANSIGMISTIISNTIY